MNLHGYQGGSKRDYYPQIFCSADDLASTSHALMIKTLRILLLEHFVL